MSLMTFDTNPTFEAFDEVLPLMVAVSFVAEAKHISNAKAKRNLNRIFPGSPSSRYMKNVSMVLQISF